MSQFPKRIIDELPDDGVRRLLESAQLDEPPARLVSSAIEMASKGVRAAGEPATSADPPAVDAGPRSGAWVAAAVVAGAVLAWGVAHEGGTRSVESVPTLASLDDPSPPTPEPSAAVADDGRDAPPKPDEHARAVTSTSVADLPDAPLSPPKRTAASAPSLLQAEADAPAVRAQAADLLREANRLRARGEWSEAAATYRRVIDIGPDSAEAYPAAVALGNLELQQSRPLAALSRYDHALAMHPNGALSEEARWGRARALRTAGRIEEERAALHEFRARHPDSPLVAAADRRLAEIGDRR